MGIPFGSKKGSPQDVVMLLSSTLEISSWPRYVSVKTNCRQKEQICPPVSAAVLKKLSKTAPPQWKAQIFMREIRRQFAENPSDKTIPKEAWDIVGKLLHEKISAAGTSRDAGLYEAWIQKHMNKKYENVTMESGAAFKKAV